MKNSAIKLIILFGIIFNVCAFDQETIDHLDFLADQFRIPNQSPGLALAIVQNGESYKSYSKGFGVRDRERVLPADENTLYAIASVTKGFTSIIAAKVVSEKFPTLGEAALDTPIIHLVPQVNFTFSDKNRHESMTLRDMLSHKSCLDYPDFMLFMGTYEDSYDYIYRSRYAQEICPFRSGYTYNNMIYDLAGQVIGMIAGKPFKDLAKEFFNELGMTRSTFITKDWNKEPNIAQAYYWTVTDPENPIKLLDSKSLDRFSLIEGTGGILSCAADMEKYVSFHLLKGKVGDKVVLPEDVLNWVYKPSNRNGNEDYGLGFGIGSYFDGTPFISHGGSIPPFEGLFSFLPSHGIGIYSVVNGPGQLRESNHDHLHISIFEFLISRSKSPALNIQKSLPVFTDVVSQSVRGNGIRQLPENSQTSIKNIINFTGIFGNAYWGNIIIGWNGVAYTFAFGEYSIGFLEQAEDPDFSNYYWIIWTSDMGYLEAWVGAGNVQPYYLHVKDNDTISLHDAQDFKRDAVRDTYPEIPWE